MKEKERQNNPKTLKFLKDVVVCRLETQRRWSYMREFPLRPDGIEGLRVALSLLKPGEYKYWFNVLSSINWGKNMLNQVFPKNENQEDFNSRDGIVDLFDKPIQVLGWDDVKKIKEEGVNLGLEETWIDTGFEEQAEERGIDLEWHFFEEPPTIKDQPTTDLLIE